MIRPVVPAVIDLVAGLAMLGLAAFLFFAGPGRRLNRLFAAFLVLRGGSTVAIALSKGAGTADGALLWAHVSVHYEIAFLAATVALVPSFPRRTRLAGHPLVWTCLVLVMAASYASFLAVPHLFVGEVRFLPTRQVYAFATGPALHVLQGLIVAAQIAMLAVLLRTQTNPRTSSITREQGWYVLAGIGVGYVYYFGFSLLYLPLRWGDFDAGPALYFQFLVGGLGLVVLGYMAPALWRASRDTGATERRRATSLFVLFGAASLVGILDAYLLARASLPHYQNSLPVWRLALCGSIAYAILRFELFDIDLKLKRWLSTGLTFGGAAGVFAVVDLGALSILGTSPVGFVGAQIASAGAVLAALSALRRVGTGLASQVFPAAKETPDYLLDRKLAVYRAALEGAIDPDGRIAAPDVEVLRGLRHELGLTDREHAVLEFAIRSSLEGGRPAAGGPFLPGSLLLGKYRVERALGEGASGRTYLCTDESLGRPVAVKHLRAGRRPEDATRILREARLLGAVQHRCVVTLFDVEQLAGEVFVVMEHVDGGSLRERIEAGGPVPLPEACAVLRDVLRGLEAAHARGIVHRDVKPANILLTTEGAAKLADFGIARDDARETFSGFASLDARAGTPAYMAPEQARGSTVDARADLYAAAAVFHECLTGRGYLDFEGRSEFEIRGAILAQPPRLPLPDQPSWVSGFLARGLQKDPGLRFQSAAEMLAALQADAGELLAR